VQEEKNMMTSVVLIGLVGKRISDITRFVEVERNYKNNEGKFQTDLIPVTYWSLTANNFFMNLKEGTYVGIHGRIECLDGCGVGVVCDYMEYMGGKPFEVSNRDEK
jgi:hypothetical protein